MRRVGRTPQILRAALAMSGPPLGGSDPVARYVAPGLGMTAASVEQLMRGRAAVNIRCAALIDGFHALGEDERLMSFLQPIDLAVSYARPAVLGDARFSPHGTDALQALTRSGDAAETFLLHADQALAHLLEVRNAVAARHGLRPAHPLKMA